MYDPADLTGEVYRMNLSCSSGENGCLFFKVLGMTGITDGKMC